MASYRFVPGLSGPLVQRVEDGAFIPADLGNSDRTAYLAWIAAGNVTTPLPPVPPQGVLGVRPVALRWALRQTAAPVGSTDALTYVLAALQQPALADARDAFEYMVEAERGDMLALCGALGFTTASVDTLLTLAATRPGAQPRTGPLS